jgi:hypothetical protein
LESTPSCAAATWSLKVRDTCHGDYLPLHIAGRFIV